MIQALIGVNAKKVLDVLKDKAGTGFMIMARTGLAENELKEVISELTDSNLITIKRKKFNDVGDACIYISPPQKRRYQTYLSLLN